jgi:hypothetical protein
MIAEPESTEDSLEKVRRAEVLAFSCVLALAATWVVLGSAGLRTLEKNPLPQMPIRQHTSVVLRQCPIRAVSVPTISSWLQNLRNFVSPEDEVTPRLLQYLDQRIYREHSAHRVQPSDLRIALAEILTQAYEGWKHSPFR